MLIIVRPEWDGLASPQREGWGQPVVASTFGDGGISLCAFFRDLPEEGIFFGLGRMNALYPVWSCRLTRPAAQPNPRFRS